MIGRWVCCNVLVSESISRFVVRKARHACGGSGARHSDAPHP